MLGKQDRTADRLAELPEAAGTRKFKQHSPLRWTELRWNWMKFGRLSCLKHSENSIIMVANLARCFINQPIRRANRLSLATARCAVRRPFAKSKHQPPARRRSSRRPESGWFSWWTETNALGGKFPQQSPFTEVFATSKSLASLPETRLSYSWTVYANQRWPIKWPSSSGRFPVFLSELW